MFEKEAEEIVKRNVCGDCNKCQSHGYIGCDIYRYSKDSCLYGLRKGYNKVNEWNCVKDGIFPKDEEDILCQINFETYEVGYYHQEKRRFYTIDGREIEVIAWKEIVLPEPPKYWDLSTGENNINKENE